MEEYMPYMHAALRQICKVYITETPGLKKECWSKSPQHSFFSFSHVDHFVKTLPDTENLFTDNLKHFLKQFLK